ncbi:hypothetical protein DFS34DRAFT_652672 [Phlyctochytrium arcticum]|nr:hypothetical protein DFS34DRAFT_652672 [Phlyctochytrium arcticum]
MQISSSIINLLYHYELFLYRAYRFEDKKISVNSPPQQRFPHSSVLLSTPPIMTKLHLPETSPTSAPYSPSLPTLTLPVLNDQHADLFQLEAQAAQYPAPEGTETAVFRLAIVHLGLRTKVHAALLALKIIHLVIRVDVDTYIIIQFQNPAAVSTTAAALVEIVGSGRNIYKLLTPDEQRDMMDGSTLPKRLPYACAILPTPLSIFI